MATLVEFWNWLMCPEGQVAILEEVRAKYGWLYHRTYHNHVASIQRIGIIRTSPGTSRTPLPHWVERSWGERMALLQPTFSSVNRGEEWDTVLAISTKDLPPVIGIDWSFPELVDGLTMMLQSMKVSTDAVPLAVSKMAELGSFAFYGGIPPTVIRYMNSDDQPDPAHWPALASISPK